MIQYELSAQDLIYSLQNPHPASLLILLTEEHQTAPRQLAEIFNTAAPQTKMTKVTETNTAPATSPRVRVSEPPAATPRVADNKFAYVHGASNRDQVSSAAKQHNTKLPRKLVRPETAARADMPVS
jgi:uncharacterized iron-regulated membrane protein